MAVQLQTAAGVSTVTATIVPATRRQPATAVGTTRRHNEFPRIAVHERVPVAATVIGDAAAGFRHTNTKRTLQRAGTPAILFATGACLPFAALPVAADAGDAVAGEHAAGGPFTAPTIMGA